MDKKEVVVLDSIKDILKFILKKVCFKRVRDVEFKLYTKYDREYLFSLLVDNCLVFNAEYMAATLVLKDRTTLLPCIINMENYKMVKDVISNILLEVPKDELDIDISNQDLYIVCTYRNRNILRYDVKKDTLEKVDSSLTDLIDTLGNFMIDFDIDNDEDDEDDDSYNV